jgi:hypothetical protein
VIWEKENEVHYHYHQMVLLRSGNSLIYLHAIPQYGQSVRSHDANDDYWTKELVRHETHDFHRWVHHNHYHHDNDDRRGCLRRDDAVHNELGVPSSDGRMHCSVHAEQSHPFYPYCVQKTAELSSLFDYLLSL